MTTVTSAAPVRDVQLRIRGLRIHAQVHGEGEPLLLYSGIWGEVRLWDRLLPHLAGFQTIAFDPPGIGRSQRPPYPLSMWSLAQMGTAVLDAFGIESAHVLGASFGGAVAQQMAFSHPRRVRRLVLVSTSFGGGAMPGNLRAAWHFIHPRSYHPERLERVAGQMFGGRLRTEPEIVRSMHIRRPTDTRAALYRMAGLFGWTSLPWLWAIDQPHPGPRRRRRPGHAADQPPGHGGADPAGQAACRRGWRAPGPDRQRRPGRAGDHRLPPAGPRGQLAADEPAELA